MFFLTVTAVASMNASRSALPIGAEMQPIRRSAMKTRCFKASSTCPWAEMSNILLPRWGGLGFDVAGYVHNHRAVGSKGPLQRGAYIRGAVHPYP